MHQHQEEELFTTVPYLLNLLLPLLLKHALLYCGSQSLVALLKISGAASPLISLGTQVQKTGYIS